MVPLLPGVVSGQVRKSHLTFFLPGSGREIHAQVACFFIDIHRDIVQVCCKRGFLLALNVVR